MFGASVEVSKQFLNDNEGYNMLKNSKLIVGAALSVFLSFSASSAVILSSDFDNRTIAPGSNTANNPNFIENGVVADDFISASSPLFDTVDSQGLIAVDQNIQTEGLWEAFVDLSVLANSITLDSFSFDAFIFSNAGVFQSPNTSRDLDLTFSIFDSNTMVVFEQTILDVFPSSGAFSNGDLVTFDLGPTTLLANTDYVLSIKAFSNESLGNNAGFDNLLLTGSIVTNVNSPAVYGLFGFLAISLLRRKLK